MIIGGLIIFSVIWCIVRCACCGLSCCCSCFQCLKCCGDCCGCCDPPRGSRRKYLDEPYIPPNHGYKSQEPMHSGFGGPTVTPATKAPTFPQYAEFDSGPKKAGDEDALPQMPSWEGAERKKVMLEEEEGVEMNALKKPDAPGQTAGATAMGGANGRSTPSGPRSPGLRSPYGAPGTGAGAGPDGYFAANGLDNDPYSQGAPGYNQPGGAYGDQDQGYGMAGAAMGPGRRSPHNPYTNNNNGYNDPYNTANNTGYSQTRDYHCPTGGQNPYNDYGASAQQPQPYDDYSQPTAAAAGYGIPRHQTPHEMDASPYPSDARASPAPQYGNAGARRSPAPQGPYGGSYGNGSEARRSPAPGQQQFGGPEARRSPAPRGPYGPGYGNNPRASPAPQGEYGGNRGYGNSNNGGSGNRGYGSPRAAPQRQYSNNTGNGGNDSPAGGAPQDNSGFDFTSGYSRPLAGGGAASPGGYRGASPANDTQGGQGGYPGYKPYTPA